MPNCYYTIDLFLFPNRLILTLVFSITLFLSLSCECCLAPSDISWSVMALASNFRTVPWLQSTLSRVLSRDSIATTPSVHEYYLRILLSFNHRHTCIGAMLTFPLLWCGSVQLLPKFGSEDRDFLLIHDVNRPKFTLSPCVWIWTVPTFDTLEHRHMSPSLQRTNFNWNFE